MSLIVASWLITLEGDTVFQHVKDVVVTAGQMYLQYNLMNKTTIGPLFDNVCQFEAAAFMI